MKKIFGVLARDIRSTVKDGLALWVIIIPLLFAVIINLVSPGIIDTTINFAVHTSVDTQRITALKKIARVHTYNTTNAVNERVLRRDEVFGILPADNSTIKIIAQGNESESSTRLAKGLNALYDLNALNLQESRVSFADFGKKTQPLKTSLSISLLLIVTIVASMLTALNLIDEKSDKTIRAVNVTPMKQTVYLLSKAILGFLVLIIDSVAVLFILGITTISWIQMFMMLISIGVLSAILAFIMGLNSRDFIEAAGTMKLLMLPLVASILVYELTSDAWHYTVWWSPFFWAYKGLHEIMNGVSSWKNISIYTLVILFLCALVFKLSTKKIRKGLN